MKKFEVEFAIFRIVEIEADSLEEAQDKAATMEDEEIENRCKRTNYMIWNDARPLVIDED